LYHLSEHTLDDVHGEVDLCALDIEAGDEPDGILASGEEENAAEAGSVDDLGGQRGVLEGDAAYEAAATGGAGDERGEERGEGGEARVEVVCDGGDVRFECWGGEAGDDVVPETRREDGPAKGGAVRAWRVSEVSFVQSGGRIDWERQTRGDVIGDLVSDDDCSDGEAVRQGLCHRDNVGVSVDRVGRVRPHRARPEETALLDRLVEITRIKMGKRRD